jgi:asparagine synthase (glutamine-hydrolysing)
MCGILGTIRGERRLSPADFDRMLDTLEHRGPDGRGVRIFDEGRVMLGHRRLAIIDLSSAGSQPLGNEDGSLWLTFNGEIYNYRSLRRELLGCGHRFASQSDSEVIVHGYEQWGAEVLRRLRGIFAFGLWDCHRHELLLARDAFGVKPLYYARYSGHFTFASQPKAIVEDPTFQREIDADALRDFFAFGYVPHDRAIFTSMAKLPAAHYAIVRRTEIDVRRYWQIEYDVAIEDAQECAWRLRDALVDATQSQLVSDVPVGCFLSGGIDSSLLVSLARPPLDELRTFTIGFDEAASDERGYARTVADHFQTRHFENVMHGGDVVAKLRNMAEYFDEPFDPNGPLPCMEVARLAREHDTVVALGGDGADELFAGYLRYDDFDRPHWALHGIGRQFWRGLRYASNGFQRSLSEADLARFFRYEGCLTDSEQALLLSERFTRSLTNNANEVMRPFFRTDLPAVACAQFLDLNLFLVDHILCKVDRAAMAYGVEARVPFLDPAVVNVALRIPHAVNYANGERKALLKLLADQYLPDAVVSARKKGFSSPLWRWGDAGFSTWSRQQLHEGILMQHGILRGDWEAGLEKIAATNPAGAARTPWLLIAAELWARRWLEHQSAADMQPLVGGAGSKAQKPPCPSVGKPA